MTYSGQNNPQDPIQDAEVAAMAATLEPKYFPASAAQGQIHSNEYAGAPYYFDVRRNSWIFYIPGTAIIGPPVDPAAGNIWIDPTNAYLMYIYNAGEFNFPEAEPETWYALTTNKRAYDYMAVALAGRSGDVNITRSSGDVSIYNQTYLYFNTNDLDLKVRIKSIDDSTGDVVYEWASVSQRTIIGGVQSPPPFAPPLQHLEQSVDDLTAKVEALKKAVLGRSTTP